VEIKKNNAIRDVFWAYFIHSFPTGGGRSLKVIARIKAPNASRGKGMGRGCPLSIGLGGRGSVVSSPTGVRGGALAENGL